MASWMCARKGCGMSRSAHPAIGCSEFVPQQDKNVPLTCPWGCEKPVMRGDLERHAVETHGQTPATPKIRRKVEWLAYAPPTEAHARDAQP